MATTAPVPHHYPIVTPAMLNCLLKDDELREQRAFALETLAESYYIYDRYFDEQGIPASQEQREADSQFARFFHRARIEGVDRPEINDLINPDIALEVLGKTEQTTLLPNRTEDRAFIERLAFEATEPFEMAGFITYLDKMNPAIKTLKEHPDVPVAIVLNYPHGSLSPEESARQIHAFAEWAKKEGIENPLHVDTVANYEAWMRGDHDLVRRTMEAEAKACRENGILWKSIMMVSVHPFMGENGGNKNYPNDFFKSVYDMTKMALECGATVEIDGVRKAIEDGYTGMKVKTSTGQSGKQPYNDFVSKDVGHILVALPMMIALADFNREYGTRCGAKYSGGQESEADAGVFLHATRKILPDVEDEVVWGANYRFRKRLLDYVARERGLHCGVDPKYLMPWDLLDLGAIKPHRGCALAAIDPNRLPDGFVRPGIAVSAGVNDNGGKKPKTPSPD